MSDPLTRVPELVQGLDVRKLPLSALEGFVLSRIDGRAPVREIVAVTGLPAEQVVAMLDRLCSLGAARWKGEGSISGASARPVATPPAPERPAVPPVRTEATRPASSASPAAARDAGPSTPPTRKKSSGNHPPVRRPMGESGVSQPPPDLRRPAVSAPTANSQVPTTPPTTSRGEVFDTAKTEPAIKAVPPGDPTPTLYDPRELDEECELPRERRKQVLDLFYRLKDLDFYEALEIPYDADKKQIRSAYFALSKSFHPDTMFRKELGSYKAKMEAVFRYLTEAYDTLSKKKARDEYDAYLQSTKATQIAERALVMAARDQAEAARAVQVEVPPLPPMPGGFGGSSEVEVAPPREASDEARKLAQEVVSRRLRGVMPARSSQVRLQPVGAEQPAPASQQPPQAPQAPAERGANQQQLLQQLGRALKGASEATTGRPADRLTQLLEASQVALGQGELEQATQLMRRAISLAPERPDLRADYEKLSKQLSEKLADEYVVQAQFEAKHGKWAAAALAWGKVCEGRPQDFGAHRQAALALFKVGGDLRSAQKYAQQAVFLAPGDVDARVLLAQIYLTLGLKLNAKRELDAALKLDPGSEIVKNLLSDLKG
ncbi:MAG: DnaJ domain-containing protein [Myxococcales bacterium]